MTEGNYDVYWCGDKGIHMKVMVEVRGFPLVIDIKGFDEPVVTLRPGVVPSRWEEDVKQWMEKWGYLAIWHEKAASYRHLLSQVELPYHPLMEPHLKLPIDVSKSLVYKLSTGDDDSFYIEMLVVVNPDIVSIDVGLIDGNENGPVYTYMGVCTATLPLTMDSLKATVNPVVEEFVGRVRALMGQPLLSLY